MAYAERVQDTTTTVGTGDITVSGTPPTSYQTISACGGTGSTFPYVIVGGAECESGTGTITGANTFSRSPKYSSNGGALVNFSAGTKTVFCDLTAWEYLNGAVTLTNKRIQPRVSTVNAPGATPAVNTDNYDRLTLTGIAVDISGITVTGTPVAGDTLAIDFTAASVRQLVLGGSFENSGTVTAPTQTVSGQKLSMYFEWNPASSRWRCVGFA